MGITRCPGKQLRKTAANLTEWEKVSFWLALPLTEFYEWVGDIVENVEERRKHKK